MVMTVIPHPLRAPAPEPDEALFHGVMKSKQTLLKREV